MTSRKLYDIFSLGVLFWEISSGRPPFKDRDYDQYLMNEIANGAREKMVADTPDDYYNLYIGNHNFFYFLF
jgi:serine/threonine protein kinase